MPDRILKTVVIGLGRIAWSDHLPFLQKDSRFELTALADPLEERGKEGMELFQVPRSYTSVEDLLKNEKADLAVICSPTGFHAQQSIAFLEHGIHVFCDKPAASSLAETCAMFEAAEKNNRKLMIYQPRRLFPNSHAIRQIFASGKLGKIYQMKLAVNSYSRRNDWQAFRKYGGGMLRNYGAHYVDQLISILKEDFEILMCESSCVATVGDADDVFKLVMKGKSSSILVDIDVNQAAGVYPYVWILYGEHGAAYLPRFGGEWVLRYFDPAELPELPKLDTLAAPGRLYPSEPIPFREEHFVPELPEKSFLEQYYSNMYDTIVHDSSPLVPAQDTLALMSLLEQAIFMAEGK